MVLLNAKVTKQPPVGLMSKLMMLRTLLGKIRARVGVYRNYMLLKRRAKANHWAFSTPSVLFRLTDIRQEPYYFPVVFALHEAGYNVFIDDHIMFIGNASGPGRFIYELSRVTICTKPAVPVDLLVTDCRKSFATPGPCRKKVLLLPRTSGAGKGNKPQLPYPMHPNAYRFRYFDKLAGLRGQERKCRVLFSGNTDEAAYSNPVIGRVHGKLNRVEVIGALLRHLDGACLRVVKTKEDLIGQTEAYFPGIRLYLWQWSPAASRGLDIRVPNEQWHDFLATGDFFLCCPGIVIPQSHNAIEAMAVGAIPILQYAEYFHPALAHGVNCIAFSGEADLVEKIWEVMRMDASAVARMRLNVIAYYEKYLHHATVAAMLAGVPEGGTEVYYYNEVV